MRNHQLILFTPPEDTGVHKIRSELNLEKWSIWMPAQSRVKRTEIVRERETTREDGSKEQARVTIQSVGKLGLFTTEDQKTYYALIKLWEEKGKPDGLTVVPPEGERSFLDPLSIERRTQTYAGASTLNFGIGELGFPILPNGRCFNWFSGAWRRLVLLWR